MSRYSQEYPNDDREEFDGFAFDPKRHDNVPEDVRDAELQRVNVELGIFTALAEVREIEADRVTAELERARTQYRWRPIAEMHEDFGDCVLMNLKDPGYIRIGSNLDLDWDELRWTHFVPVPSLTHEEAARLAAALTGEGEGKC